MINIYHPLEPRLKGKQTHSLEHSSMCGSKVMQSMHASVSLSVFCVKLHCLTSFYRRTGEDVKAIKKVSHIRPLQMCMRHNVIVNIRKQNTVPWCAVWTHVYTSTPNAQALPLNSKYYCHLVLDPSVGEDNVREQRSD